MKKSTILFLAGGLLFPSAIQSNTNSVTSDHLSAVKFSPYSISSSDSETTNPASLANDKDYKTYWKSKEKENQSLTIDLGEIKSLNRVTQIFLDEDLWYFTIEASMDNSDFFQLMDNSYGSLGRVFDVNCSGYARYIRLNIIKSEKGFLPSSKEFIVEADSLADGENVALGLNGSCSSFASNYGPEMAFDGNTGTYYCSSDGSYPQYLGCDLATSSYVKNINIRLQDYGTYNFEVEARKSDGTWYKIEDTSNHTGTFFSFEVNQIISGICYRVFSGPGWANVVEVEAIGFEKISSTPQNEIYDLKHLTYIEKVEGNSQVQGSIDGINFEPLNSNNSIYRYLKSSYNLDIYGLSLTSSLSNGLDGIVSDFASEEHHISKATNYLRNSTALNDSWRSNITGGSHFLSLDLGNICYIEEIYQRFESNDLWKFKIEVSKNGQDYVMYKDFIASPQEGQDFIIANELEDKYYRYVKLTIESRSDQTANSTLFDVRGNGSPIIENWWEKDSGVIRFYPKLQKVTLREIITRLDEFRYSGYKIIELHQPYEGLADIWAGLGGTNNYQVDPVIGTLDDLSELLDLAHSKGMKVFMFGNVGYGKYTAEYFKKACKDYALGINSKERNWFLFSKDCPDPTKWFFSDVANAYFYGYWGENGKIPTFNFNNIEWQEETYQYISFWSDMGIDGIALDAPDVYYWGGANASEVTYNTITNTLRKNNMFALPEGSGDTKFISSYKYSAVQNYAVSSWGGNAFSLGINAVRNHSSVNVDESIKYNRDAAVSLGGVSIDGMNFEENYDITTDVERILETALVTSTGHLSFLHLGSADRPGQDIMEKWPEKLKQQIASIFALQNSLSSLNPTGARYKLNTSNSTKNYAFYRSNLDGKSKSIPVFNFARTNDNVQINLAGTGLNLDSEITIYDAYNDEALTLKVENGIVIVPMTATSYRCLIVR